MTNFKISERIDKEKALYLLSLDEETLLNMLSDEYKKCKGEIIYKKSKEHYLKSLQNYLKVQLGKNCCLEFKYKYSKRLSIVGRQFTDGFSLQGLQKNIRNFLVQDIYNDYDMINAHPTILLYLLNIYYKEHKFPFLEQYVNNRNKILKEHKINKLQVLVCLNSNKKIKSTRNKFLYHLDSEFKKIQDLIYDKQPDNFPNYNHYKGLDKTNSKGSFLNTILCIYENKIIEEIVNNFDKKDIGTVMFDGLFLDYKLPLKQTIKKLNKITNKYNIKWTMKKPDDIIKTDKNQVEKAINELELKTYEEVKNKFEKNHFLIRSPLMFVNCDMLNDKKIYKLYGLNDFKILVNPFKYLTDNGKEKQILTDWLLDKDRKEYKKIEFIPDINFKSNDIFNTFNGFEYDNINCSDYKPNKKCIVSFIELINNIVGKDEKSKNYLLDYIAHLFQKTLELPEVAIMIKSKEGYGKDMMITIIEILLGESYVYRTAKINDVFGNFNSSIKDKILLQLNELEGKDGYGNKEKIKDIITAKTLNINEKNIKTYPQQNRLRLFLFSNNLKPIEISYHERRFVVFSAVKTKPPPAFFNNLVKTFIKNDNKEVLKNNRKTLYEYFMNRDISNFEPRKDRPLTDSYKEMRNTDIHPLYSFLYDNFNNEELYKESFKGIHKIKKTDTRTIYILCSDMLEKFKDYLYNKDIRLKINCKLLKLLLINQSFEYKQIKINNVNNKYYLINLDTIENMGKAMNLSEEIEELTEDDFI